MSEPIDIAIDPRSWDPPPRQPPAWHRVLTVGVLVVVVAGLAFVAWSFFEPASEPERIHASPAAATPAGYRSITTKDVRVSVPSGWKSRAVVPEIYRKGISLLAGSGSAATEAASNLVDGSPLLAADPVTRDSVQVIPMQAVNDDLSEPDARAQLQATAQALGVSTGAPSAEAVDVHGFPGVRLRIDTVRNNTAFTIITTIIQTGDRLYQVVVTSRSGARAADLTRRIVPTFDPR